MIKDVLKHSSQELQRLSHAYQAMRHQEEEIKDNGNRDYLREINCDDGKNIPHDNLLVDEKCREKMSLWFFQVIEFCNFRRIIANISMSYLDRYLGTKHGRTTLYDRREYQLAAMCCLELAVKIHESQKLELSLLSELSQGTYSISELAKKEREILFALNWRMCLPTSSCFTNFYLNLLPHNIPHSIKDQIIYLTNLQIDSSVEEYCFLSFRPSEIALASVLNAMAVLNISSINKSSFQRDIIQITGIGVASDIIINKIREKLRKPLMECSFLLMDKMSYNDSHRRKLECESHSNVKISPNCISSKQA